MKIAKEFKWEMAHRLPFHKGKCRNLHGHTYRMRIELEGEIDENGMVMDYYDVAQLVEPLVDRLDHSVMAYEKDEELIEALQKISSKVNVVPFQTTAENICRFFLKEIKTLNSNENIRRLKIWIFETEDTYAVEEIAL